MSGFPFRDCVKYFTPLLDSATITVDDLDVVYTVANSYIKKAEGTNEYPKLPKPGDVYNLLPFPVFQSEVAFNALKQATAELKTNQGKQKTAQNMKPLLTQAEEYYQAIVDDPEMETRWYGHAGLAETFALKAKLAQREGGEEEASFKQQAKDKLTSAIAKSEQAKNPYGKGITLPYQMGNELPEKQHNRIQNLLW